MATVIQRNFAGGEIAPALYSRADTVKYSTGLRTMRNFFIMRHGGAASRPGSTFVTEVKDSSQPVRLIPFVFNSSQTYVIELGNQYARFIKNGSYALTQQSVFVHGIASVAGETIITTGGVGTWDPSWNNFDRVITGIVGMTELNGLYFTTYGSTNNSFKIKYKNGGNVDSSLFHPWISGGELYSYYEIATPYLTADLSTLNFTQSADVITIAHPNYPPQEIRRYADDSWTMQSIIVDPEIARPTNLAITATVTGSDTVDYKVTAVSADDSEESLCGSVVFNTITSVSNANPAVMVASAGGSPFVNEGDEVLISATCPGMPEIAGRLFIATNISGSTFELYDELGNPLDTTSYGTYTSGGTVSLTRCSATSVGAPTPTFPFLIGWTASANASSYNIYRSVNGIYGFIGNASKSPFSDVGTTPNLTVTPPGYKNPFSKPGDYPSTVAYIQQRLTFANTNNNPETVYMSRSGQYKNFTTSLPIQSSDSITFGLVGRQVNAVKNILELSNAIVFTSGAEWSVRGDVSGIISPTSINARQNSYNGCSTIRPIIISNSAIYVQARGGLVRDLTYDIRVDGYDGNDLTIFSAHLFDGFTIVDWDYQQIPHSIVWAVRSDGVLLSLTYIKEQEMAGWARHDFSGGFVENVCVVPEGSEDSVYVTVRRTINGTTVRYIERLNHRTVYNVVDFVGSDSAVTYDGRNYGSTTMTMSGSGWTYSDVLTLTSSVSMFAAIDVGNQIQLTGPDGTLIRFNILGYTNSTTVTGSPNKNVPVSMQATALKTWTKAIKYLTGLRHLEGQNVSVLGDGFVVASPNNASNTVVTVTNGVATFDKPYGVIQLGLPFVCDLQTLDIDNVQGESMIDKYKNVSRLWMHLQDSRGIWAGGVPPTDDSVDPLEGLFELKVRNMESPDDPVALATTVEQINIQSDWNSNGRVFIRQVDPVPLTVLSIAPAGKLPFQVGG